MEEVKKYILDGYRFDSETQFERARAEMDRISEIKKIHDLRDELVLRKLYDESVEGEDFLTPIGVGFLREIQKKLIQSPEQKKTMKAIPVKDLGDFKRSGTSSDSKEGRADTSLLFLKIRNLRIVIFFLILITIVLFAVTILDRTTTFEKAKEAVINEYASWKEELTVKEAELRVREQELKKAGELRNK